MPNWRKVLTSPVVIDVVVAVLTVIAASLRPKKHRRS
jgi:hypothetical protein